MSKVKVDAVVIQYPDGSRKSLSIEDARALYRELAELFGHPTAIPPVPIVIERERWPRWAPTWTDDGTPHQVPAVPDLTPRIWCCAETGG